MRLYGGDMEGKLGYKHDVASDMDDPDGVTKALINNENVPDHYISLQDLDYKHFLLYDSSNDHVVFLEDGNTAKLVNESLMLKKQKVGRSTVNKWNCRCLK